MAGQGGREREEGVGREVQICTDGLSGRRGNASQACWRESSRGLAPPKTTPHLCPCPLLLGLRRAVPLFLHPPFLITYAGDLNSKYFVCVISFSVLLFYCMPGGRGQPVQTLIHLRTCHMEEASEGLRKKLPQHCICTDCITFKLPGLK
uniref:Uncharacterized protein n=1 Tax=Mus spicilegus TaxID=10103 RepID=A0A8C6H6G7_MUSSI